MSFFHSTHLTAPADLCLTHCVPNVDVALAPPVIALREGLSVREHVAFCKVCTLSKAIVIQPGSPVIDVARAGQSIGCSGREKVLFKKN